MPFNWEVTPQVKGMGSSTCGIQSCESHEGHLGVLTETFPKSLEVQLWPFEDTESGKHWKAWYSESSAAGKRSVCVEELSQVSWWKTGQCGCCSQSWGRSPALCEPVLEQGVGKAPSQDVAFQPEEDLEILRGFAK